ncbi:MAG TPA: iron-containing redox enzyme family protein [Gemmatimonadaceae bacterium]|nr:iron-containing redox enzyme family protein [Gemmatimonadaceae bacterium]
MLKSIELPTFSLVRRDHAAPAPGESFATRLSALLASPALDAALDGEPGLEERLVQMGRDLADRAYPADRTTTRHSAPWIDHAARTDLHRALLVLYKQHVQLPDADQHTYQFHPFACRMMRVLEGPWESDVLRRVRKDRSFSLDDLPAEPAEFAKWYQLTAFAHPLYEHELYAFLASDATRRQLEWFLKMECAGEAAFDDLVALAQVGTRGEVKMEMASNYWDEMGRGKSQAVHTHLFHQLIDDLRIEAPDAGELPWEVLSGVNLMLWSCIHRRNAFRAQGVLGAVELLAPQRCTRVVHGATRLGLRKKTVVYYGAHAIIDIGHAEGWLDHVVEAQVREVPAARLGIAEGLLARANASLDYFDFCLAGCRTVS